MANATTSLYGYGPGLNQIDGRGMLKTAVEMRVLSDGTREVTEKYRCRGDG